MVLSQRWLDTELIRSIAGLHLVGWPGFLFLLWCFQSYNCNIGTWVDKGFYRHFIYVDLSVATTASWVLFRVSAHQYLYSRCNFSGVFLFIKGFSQSVRIVPNIKQIIGVLLLLLLFVLLKVVLGFVEKQWVVFFCRALAFCLSRQSSKMWPKRVQ